MRFPFVTVHGNGIQLSDVHDYELKDAEESYLTAFKLNPFDLEVIEALAHYYDAVDPDVKKARKFAQSDIACAGKSLAAMENIFAKVP